MEQRLEKTVFSLGGVPPLSVVVVLAVGETVDKRPVLMVWVVEVEEAKVIR